MDPNTCLQAIRSAYTALLALIDTDRPDTHDVTEIASDLATGAQDLDTWLCRGGHAPTAWAEAGR